MKKDKLYILFDDYNQKLKEDIDVIGTISTQIGNAAFRHAYKIIEVDINRHKDK